MITTAPHPAITLEQYRLAAPVKCIGFLVRTAITDGDGKVSPQHSPIYHTKLKAEQVAATGRTKLHCWERKIERTVEECETSFPLSDVLAGRAMRLSDWRAAERRAA